MHSKSHQPRIGIDLGGTKTEVIALSSDGETMLRKRVSTPRHSYQEIVQTVAHLVSEARQVTGLVSHVGVGVPGAPDLHSGRMKNANTTCLIGKPLAHDLSLAMGCPVVLENDANCFTLSEAVDGSGRDKRVVFGVILGTGVGGGWVINRELHSGMHHISGEWGHNPIPVRYLAKDSRHARSNGKHAPATDRFLASLPFGAPFVDLGRRCYCGLSDCIETHLCGSGLLRTHAWVQAHAPAIGIHPAILQNLETGQQLAQAAQAGDPLCTFTLELYGRQLACALATVINLIDPDVIVLGGGVSNVSVIYPHMQQALTEYIFNDRADTPIVKAAHGDSSGVRGAAWL